MDLDARSTNWEGGESSTLDPIISSIAEEIPSLTVATIIGVACTVLFAIGLVFTLGVLLDCRQQRILENKQKKVMRLKTQRRVKTIEVDVEGEGANIAENAELPGLSNPPALMVEELR